MGRRTAINDRADGRRNAPCIAKGQRPRAARRGARDDLPTARSDHDAAAAAEQPRRGGTHVVVVVVAALLERGAVCAQ